MAGGAVVVPSFELRAVSSFATSAVAVNCRRKLWYKMCTDALTSNKQLMFRVQ